MEKKMIVKAGFVFLLPALVIGVLVSFSKPATGSGSKTSVQPAGACCKMEKDTTTGTNPVFEALPGKFFSAVLIN